MKEFEMSDFSNSVAKCVSITGDAAAGIILSRIIYWYDGATIWKLIIAVVTRWLTSHFHNIR